MRAGLCTVSAPLVACRPASTLPPSARFLALHRLHQQTLYFVVQSKSRVRELYQQTCLYFSQQGMLDTDLFGLALICDGEYLFADPDSKLAKYAPKSWRSSRTHGLDANGRPALAFYFRVQFYVDSPLLLRDESTRQHYYHQLRLNAASGIITNEVAMHLAALALQADFGDHNDSIIFRPEDYVPPNLRGPAALNTIQMMHRSHRGLGKTEARSRFIAEVCQLENPVNAHVFKLRASKNEPAPGSLLLGVSAKGLRVFPDNNPPAMFLWSSIGKLSFERKKFEIRTGHEKLTLYTTSDEKSRLLLALCKATHLFSMNMAPRLTEVRREEEEKQKWGSNQRVSVISTTSSNTTSGIVSDRVHSEDELEIMITSPPAPSTESLALVHLLESTPASSRTSASSAAAAFSSFSLKTDRGENKSIVCDSTVKAVSGKGTECNSSSSTVASKATNTEMKTKKQRSIAGSSLELDFSHTAQNSVVSNTTCVELDVSEPAYEAGPAPSSQTSGVYTLTSSEQYTLNSSDQYSPAGEQIRQDDQVDGLFRSRTNSNVSNFGSFHGDGSDPTDTKQSLLSAKELSDLIVGKYPSSKSVSHTLDSYSDYVTLPTLYQDYIPSPKRIGSCERLFRPPPPQYDMHLASKSTTTESIYSGGSSRLSSPPPYPEHKVVPTPVFPGEVALSARPPSALSSYSNTKSTSSFPSSKRPILPKMPRSNPQMRTLISPNNYLDVAASKASIFLPCTFLPPPPPPPQPRQPPPPPPPPPPAFTTVYTSQLARSQIEQYKNEMYSDVDFVMFPLKEPAISKQEYLEAKHGSILAALIQTQPMFYRSTPYLSRSENLSDTYVQLPVYGVPTRGKLEPPPPPLPPHRPSKFLRTRSNDNILSSFDSPRHPTSILRRPLPPPPVRWSTTSVDNLNGTAKEHSTAAEKALDIRTLREKSKNMDLPLISALCNDRSLIKQTKAFVMPKHANNESVPKQPSKDRFPVSGLSAKTNKPAKKATSVSHRHPSDKLPDIPCDTRSSNSSSSFVNDSRTKHKVIHSQS